MQRHTVSLLIALILLSATPAGTYAAESPSTVIPSIIMDAPQGYVEIDPEEFPDFARPLATEYSNLRNELLHIFVKNEELPHVRNGDFDLLTTVVTASWHNSVKKRRDNADGTRTRENVMGIIGPFLLLADRVDMKRFERIEETFLNREILPAADKNGRSLPGSRIGKWLQEGPDAPDMELGCIETGSKHALFAWLQADTDFFDFGVMAHKPLAVALGLVDVEGKTLSLIAASSFTTPAGASAPVELLSSYLVEGKHTFTPVRGTRIERRLDCFNLLSSAAELWEGQGKAEKAVAAYKRRMLFWKKAARPDAALSQVMNFSAVYLKNGRHAEILREVPPLLEEGQALLGADDSTVILIKGLLGIAYRDSGKISEAAAVYEEALTSSLRACGRQNEITANIQLELSTILALGEEYKRALALSEEALAVAVEIYGPGGVATYAFRMVANLVSSGEAGLAMFYAKLAAGLIWYNDNCGSGKVDIDEYTQEGVIHLMSGHLKRLGKATTPEAFEAYWRQPNEASDTPWNKGRELMSDKEIALYEQFGKTAEALHRAGLSGSEAEKEKARADFRAWMDSVRETLAKPSPDPEKPGLGGTSSSRIQNILMTQPGNP